MLALRLLQNERCPSAEAAKAKARLSTVCTAHVNCSSEGTLRNTPAKSRTQMSHVITSSCHACDTCDTCDTTVTLVIGDVT